MRRVLDYCGSCILLARVVRVRRSPARVVSDLFRRVRLGLRRATHGSARALVLPFLGARIHVWARGFGAEARSIGRAGVLYLCRRSSCERRHKYKRAEQPCCSFISGSDRSRVVSVPLIGRPPCSSAQERGAGHARLRVPVLVRVSRRSWRERIQGPASRLARVFDQSFLWSTALLNPQRATGFII